MKDKEYFKKYIKKLKYHEFIALSQAILEESLNMQKQFLELSKTNKDKNINKLLESKYHG